MDEFRPDKPVEEEERTEDDDHVKTTEEEVQTKEGDQAKTNEEVSITMQIPRRNDQTMNQQDQLPRASSSTQVKASYAAIVSGLATSSSSSSAINEPKKKTPSSTVSGSAASSSSAINEASKKTEPTSSSTVSGLADSSCSTINEPNKKTESSSSSRNGESSGTVEIKREHVTQKENGEDDSETPAWFYDLFDESNPQEQSGNPEHRDDVVVGVVQEPKESSSSSSTISDLSASCSAIYEEIKKTESSSSTFSGSAINEASSSTSFSPQVRRSYSSVVSGLATSTSSSSAINEPSKKTLFSSSPRNSQSSGTVEIKKEHVTQNPIRRSDQPMNLDSTSSASDQSHSLVTRIQKMNLGSTSCATEQGQTMNQNHVPGPAFLVPPVRPILHNQPQDQVVPNPVLGQAPMGPVIYNYAAHYSAPRRPQAINPVMQDQSNVPRPEFIDQMVYQQHLMQVPLDENQRALLELDYSPAAFILVQDRSAQTTNQQEQLKRAPSSTGLSPYVRPWSPPNTMQQHPVANQNQMGIVRGRAPMTPLMNNFNPQPFGMQQGLSPNTAPWRLRPPSQVMTMSANYTYDPSPVFVLDPNNLDAPSALITYRYYPYMRTEANHLNLTMPRFRRDQMETRISSNGQPLSVAVIQSPLNPLHHCMLSLDNALVLEPVPEQLQPQTQSQGFNDGPSSVQDQQLQ